MPATGREPTQYGVPCSLRVQMLGLRIELAREVDDLRRRDGVRAQREDLSRAEIFEIEKFGHAAGPTSLNGGKAIAYGGI